MDDSNITAFLDVQDDPFFSGTLSALYTFAAISQYKSFRAAAQEMYISPQALSKQITALEKKLGLPLFNRSPRGFSLTPYGDLVYQYASNLLRNTKQLRRDLAAIHAETNYILRLAYSNTLYDTSLHMYMMDFMDDESLCQSKTKRLNFEQTIDVANGKEPYITVTSRPVNTDNFDVTILHNAKYYLLTHKDNPLATLNGVDLEDLGETTLILCVEHSRANQYLLKYCSEHKMSINARLETAGLKAGIERCQQNNGALLMADYIEEHFDTENLVRVSPKSGLFSLELVMLVRKDLEYSPMEHKFIKYMKAYMPH